MEISQEWTQRANAVAEQILGKYNLQANHANDVAAEVMAALAAQGLLQFGFTTNPDKKGPQKGDMAKAATVISALAGKSGVLASIYMVTGLLAPLCVSYQGATQQKADLLNQVAQGKLQLAFAFTDVGMKTRATLKGNKYILNGEKTYITGANTADIILTVASPSSENSKTLLIFMVPKGAENLSIEPLPELPGGNVHPSCLVRFKEVSMGVDQILGGEQAGEDIRDVLRTTGALERVLVAAVASGIARAASQRVSAYINERSPSGKMLKEVQVIRHTVAEMHTLTKSMELFVEYAVREQENSSNPIQAISMAKYFNTEQLQRVVGLAVRVMGSRSYFEFEPISRFYKEAISPLFAGGTIELQKALIARSLGL